MTRATVNARLDRLVENGVIVGFSVRVRDPADASVVRAIMLIAVGVAAPRVIRNLRGVPEIAALHTTNGEWDLIAEMNCESLAAFDHALRGDPRDRRYPPQRDVHPAQFGDGVTSWSSGDSRPLRQTNNPGHPCAQVGDEALVAAGEGTAKMRPARSEA